MIKTSGYRVSPTEIEEVAYGTGLVARCGRARRRGPGLGQRIVLVASPAGRRTLDRDELLGDAAQRSCRSTWCPSDVVRPRRAAALAQRQVRPHLLRQELARVSRDRSIAAFGRVDWRLTRRRDRRSTGSPSASAHAVLRLRPRAADRARRAAARRAARARSSSATRSRPTPCRRSCSTSAASSTRFDVASARGDARRARHADAGRHGSASPGPGKTAGRAHAGGRRRRDDRAGVSDRGASASPTIGERLGYGRAWRVRVNPDFQVKGSGMRMGGGPQQFGVDAEQVPALLAELATPDLDFLGFHVFAGSQNLHAEILCEAQRKTVDLALRAGRRTSPRPVRYLNLGGGFGIPYFDKDQPLDLPRSATTSTSCSTSAIRAEPARRPRRDRARPLHRRRVRRLRDPRRRPQGVARQDLPRRRRRPAPPAGRVGQLRPGDPPQLPGRGRQPDRRRRRPRRSASSAACARRSTCSATRSTLPAGRRRRPGRRLPGRRLRADRQPHRVPRATRRPSRCWSDVAAPNGAPAHLRPRKRSGNRSAESPDHETVGL